MAARLRSAIHRLRVAPRAGVGLGALVAAAALAALPARAAAEGRPSYGGAAIASLLSEPVSLDPVRARSHAEAAVAGLIFDALYRLDPAGAAVPHLATSLPTPKAKELRIAIQAGVTFHDGSALDAADVAASLERARTGAPGSLPGVTAVRADGAEVVLALSRRADDAAANELAIALAAAPTSVTPGGAAPKAKSIIGSGPFRFASIDRKKRRLHLEAAETHFAGRPYLDALELRWFDSEDEEARAYESGVSHVSLRGAVAFAGHKPKHPTDEIQSPATLLVYVGFGKAHADVTGSRDLRAALSAQLARSAFSSTGTGERVVSAVLPLAVDHGGSTPPAAQVAARAADAKAAIDKAAKAVAALAEDAREDLALELILDRTRPGDVTIAEKVAAALFKLGLTAKLQALEPSEYVDRVARGDCDFYIGQQPGGGASAALAWSTAFALGGDTWAEKAAAKGAIDPAAAEAAFRDRLPIVPLFHRAVQASHRKSLRGVLFDGAGRVDFAGVFLDEVKPGSP